MDMEAVAKASEDDLHGMGLTEKGHIICAKVFCKENSSIGSDERKRLLANIIKQTGSERVSAHAKKFRKLGCKTIYLGWTNFDKKQNKFVGMRLNKGGGNRQETFMCNTTLQAILKAMEKIFFPHGKASIGKLSDFTRTIGNYQGDEINDFNEITLQEYITNNKLTKIRVYLLTKKMSWMEKAIAIPDADSDDEFINFIPGNNDIKKIEEGRTHRNV